MKDACSTPLLFTPGTQCRYQSMGILLAAEIVERLTKTALRDFERGFRRAEAEAQQRGIALAELLRDEHNDPHA